MSHLMSSFPIYSLFFLSILSQNPQLSFSCYFFKLLLWGRRIVWCTLTSWYLVSLLPVSIIHVSVILVGSWSWEISFIMWGCRGWGWQAARLGFQFPVKWWDSPPPSGDLEPANQYAPSKKPAGELKSLRAPKFEQKPGKFVPIGLLCKHVTNHFVTRMWYADSMAFCL